MRSPLSRLRSMTSSGSIYRDAHYLVAEMEIDSSAAARWVPWPLRLAQPRATFFTAWFPHTTFGSVYREAGLFLPVLHGRTRAVYCPWMVVDDDVALIVGRELLGYPKKLAQIDWSHSGDRIETLATRRDAKLLSMRGTIGEPIAAPPPILGVPHRNVRASLGLAVPWLLAFTPKEEIIEVRRAKLEVQVGGSERDPLAELGVQGVIESRLHRVNLGRGTLPRPVAVASPITYARNLLTRIH